MKMNQILQNIYRKAIESMKQTTFELFELTSRKTPTDSKFPTRLKKKANILIDSFITNSQTLSEAMGSIIKKTIDKEGLYNKLLFQNLKSSSFYFDSALDDKFVFTYDLKTLKSQLKSLREEKIANGIIQGRYNPFIRSHPFPPLTLKFNYLFDPRSALYSKSYEKLYDEHKDGFVTNRAAPLLVPGIS